MQCERNAALGQLGTSLCRTSARASGTAPSSSSPNPELYTDAVPNRPGREKVNLCRALGQLELTLHGCDPRINMLKADDKART